MAGRKKVIGGIRRMWTVPPDVDLVVQERGTKWLWQIVRIVLAYEQSLGVTDSDNNGNIPIRESCD